LIVGLGNPGAQYASSRHNAGYRVLDRLAAGSSRSFRTPLFARYSVIASVWDGQRLFLVKPLTFMNRSGEILPSLFRRTRLQKQQLLVICDHLDLPPGVCRLKLRGSSAGHRGLQSIISTLGTEEFLRIYVGIGRPEGGMSVPDYVLGVPKENEKSFLDKGENKAAQAILQLLTREPEQVMNELNRKS
jgi:PTH1 family peptidyl-tRNA hydrolase